MAEALHKKQQITAALTELRIRVQNEVAHSKAHPRYEETHPKIDQKSSMGMGQLRRHFRGGFCLAYPLGKRESIFIARVKSRS